MARLREYEAGLRAAGLLRRSVVEALDVAASRSGHLSLGAHPSLAPLSRRPSSRGASQSLGELTADDLRNVVEPTSVATDSSPDLALAALRPATGDRRIAQRVLIY
jgi:hypothetical protein